MNSMSFLCRGSLKRSLQSNSGLGTEHVNVPLFNSSADIPSSTIKVFVSVLTWGECNRCSTASQTTRSKVKLFSFMIFSNGPKTKLVVTKRLDQDSGGYLSHQFRNSLHYQNKFFALSTRPHHQMANSICRHTFVAQKFNSSVMCFTWIYPLHTVFVSVVFCRQWSKLAQLLNFMLIFQLSVIWTTDKFSRRYGGFYVSFE